MDPAVVVPLALPLMMLVGVGLIAFYSSRRQRQGKKPYAGRMFAGLIGICVVVATLFELMASSPEQARRAQEPAEALFRALARGEIESARSLLTAPLAERVDLSEWRLHPQTRWELTGRDQATDAIQLFYLVEHGPVDRQTVIVGFEEQDGAMQISALQRTFHLPREVLALGEELIVTLAEGRDPSGSKRFAALGEEAAAGLAGRLRSAPAGGRPRARVVAFDTARLVHVGRHRPPPWMKVRWEVETGGPPVAFTLHVTHEGEWRATGLDVHATEG